MTLYLSSVKGCEAFIKKIKQDTGYKISPHFGIYYALNKIVLY